MMKSVCDAKKGTSTRKKSGSLRTSKSSGMKTKKGSGRKKSEKSQASESSGLTAKEPSTPSSELIPRDIGSPSKGPEYKFGWGKFQPECLQIIHKPWFLLVCSCYLVIVQGFVVNGVVNAISPQLERRFHMRATEIGALSSMYDAGQLIMMIPISYFGPKAHPARWIASCAIIMGLGSFIWTIPHFAAGRYRYFDKPPSEGCLRNLTNQSVSSTDSHHDTSLRNWQYVFILAQFLHGVGASPLFTMCLTYIDENVSHRTSSFFTGIFHACAFLGPTIGYLFASWSLTIYGDIGKPGVDMDKIPLKDDDPRWYGAWWMGMILAGCMAWLIVPILYGFGRKLPGAEEARKADAVRARRGQLEEARAVEGLKRCVYFWKRLKILVHNPTFLGLVVEQVTTMFVSAGFSMFLTKYIETQYSTSTSVATRYAAAAAIPPAFIGTLLGTIIQRTLRLQCEGNLILSVVSGIGATISCAAFFAWCDTKMVAGATAPYPVAAGTNTKSFKLKHACNSGCNCTKSYYEPVCYKGIVLFSPCFAGCEIANETVADLCTCVPGNGSVRMEVCPSICAGHSLGLFMFGLALLILFIYVKQNPVSQATLRYPFGYLRVIWDDESDRVLLVRALRIEDVRIGGRLGSNEDTGGHASDSSGRCGHPGHLPPLARTKRRNEGSVRAARQCSIGRVQSNQRCGRTVDRGCGPRGGLASVHALRQGTTQPIQAKRGGGILAEPALRCWICWKMMIVNVCRMLTIPDTGHTPRNVPIWTLLTLCTLPQAITGCRFELDWPYIQIFLIPA